MVGYSLIYNTLDNNKNPTQGVRAEFKQDLAGVGGDVNFIKSTADARFYTEVMPDVVGLLRLQGGNLEGWGGKDLRMLDHFQMGPNLVRGFRQKRLRSARPDPGHRARCARRHRCIGARVPNCRFRFTSFRRSSVSARLIFADAGSLWDYKGPT